MCIQHLYTMYTMKFPFTFVLRKDSYDMRFILIRNCMTFFLHYRRTFHKYSALIMETFRYNRVQENFKY